MKKETKEKKNGTYFFIKIVLTYCEKKVFVIGWRPRICKIFEITRTIYSEGERSEQFLVTEQLEFKLEKIIGI